MEARIDYKKSLIDADIERLVLKLEPQYPHIKVLEELAAGFATPFKVLVDDALQGVLICRRVRNYNSDEILVIDHAIAEDNIDLAFSETLAHSLFSWGKVLGFHQVHQHADRPALARMLEAHYGKCDEWIFKKDLRTWEKEAQALKQARPQQAQQTK